MSEQIPMNTLCGSMMILGMAFPNILGVALLSGKVRRALDKYVSTYMTPEAS